MQLALAGCYSRIPFREHRIRCNHCFQHDCNLLPTRADNCGNLAVIQSFESSLRLTQKSPSTVLISSACRTFENALRLPSSAFPHEAQLTPIFMLAGWRTCRLTSSLFSQDEAVKPQPILNLPELSDIEDLRLRFS